MALVAGTKLGPYEVLAPLGAGGMGEVYRARDTKLGRDVALKVLPAAFARDAERMARFHREAQVLASLNHPHIAAIYGLEDSGGEHALVMELVEGPTLAERIKPGPIPLDEALPIAQQIAEALEAAHEKGIIHRDLKPANIKLAPEGAIKILDFGLAKALEGDASRGDISSSPTLTAAATQAGVILGTAAYMSPEQAKGKSVDRRADIWAFGCVLYEMLAGTKPFEGETVSETLASVIKDTPNLENLPATTPRPIRALLSRCLHKDPKHRLQAIGEARIAIEDYLANPAAEEPAAATNLVAASVARPHADKVRRAVLLVAGLALILGLAAGWWIKGRRGEPSPTWSAQMLGGPSTAFGPRISPDGHTLAFQAMVDGLTQVAVMDTDSGDWTVLTKDRSRGYVTELDWSSDGSEIYFDRQLSTPRGIYTVSRFGGEEHLILEDAVGPQVLPDGSLLVVRVNRDRDLQLYRFWPESGRVIALNGIVPFADLCPPVRAFHDGKEAVFVGNTPDEAKTNPVPHLYALDLTSGKTRRLAAGLNLASTVLSFYPLAVPADDHSVIADVREGDLHRIVAVPRSGSGPVETLLSLTAPPLFIDAGKDGTLYLDQAVRPSAVLRFSTAGGTPEILAGSDSASPGAQSTFQIPDGRVLLDSVVAGVSRLLLAKPGGDAAPFIATKEETSSPACRVGENEVAFLLGPSHHAELAIASLADGRILRRLRGVQGGEIGELVASRDGATLFYVASRTIWSIPAADGTARRLGPGDALTVDPNGHDLIVQLREKEGVRLVRVPVSGGGETPISVQGDLRLAPVSIDSSAVDQGGRMLVSLAAPDSWFYRPGSLDLRTGKLERIPLNFSGDVLGIGWQSDGRILSTGWPLKAALWRFRPAQQEKK